MIDDITYRSLLRAACIKVAAGDDSPRRTQPQTLWWAAYHLRCDDEKPHDVVRDLRDHWRKNDA